MGYKKLPFTKSTIQQRRDLRRNMTRAEIVLWSQLKGKKLGFKFRRQHPVGPFITDFFCFETRIAIELDGHHHFTAEGQERDKKRDAYFEDFGIEVIRVENVVAINEMSRILDYIEERCNERKDLFL